MANNCYYSMCAVSKNKDSLERLVKIMKYEDSEYYIYRVFDVDTDEIKQDGDFFVVHIYGDVAWSASKWFETEESKDVKSENGAHYITLDLLAKILDMGIEVWTEEPGNQFQEHYTVDHNGVTVFEDRVDWSGVYKNDLPNEDDEEYEENLNEFLEDNGLDSLDDIEWGFGDDFEEYGTSDQVYRGYAMMLNP